MQATAQETATLTTYLSQLQRANMAYREMAALLLVGALNAKDESCTDLFIRMRAFHAGYTHALTNMESPIQETYLTALMDFYIHTIDTFYPNIDPAMLLYVEPNFTVRR